MGEIKGGVEISKENIQSTIDKVSTKVDSIIDYDCIIVKRERVNGRLNDYQYMFAKVRNKPFAVYLRFLKPDKVYDREVLYTGGTRLTAKQGGLSNPNLTLKLKLDSPLAMSGQRYQITKIGIQVLTNDLKTILAEELKLPVTLTKYDNVKLYNRSGTLYRLVHKDGEASERCMAAEILIDKELDIPVYFKSWGKGGDGKPLLLEEYAYKDIRLNVGLSDKDFDEKNKEYGFEND